MYTARIKRPSQSWSSSIKGDFYSIKDIKRFLRVPDWEIQIKIDDEFVEIDDSFFTTHH